VTAILKERAKGFSQRVVEELSAARNEPAWLRQRRLEAWQTYEATPMPTLKDESWRRTDISTLPLAELWPFAEAPYGSLASPAGLPREVRALLDRGQGDGGLLVQHDSQVVYTSLAEEAAKQGVIFTSLERAAVEHRELVEPYLMTRALSPQYGKFTALNGALWSGSAFVYVPPAVDVVLPLRSLSWLASPGVAVFPHTLIVLEAGSRLSFVSEQFSPESDAVSLLCPATEVYLGEEAQLFHVTIQQMGRQAYIMDARRHLLERDSRLESLTIALGGKLTKSFVEGILVGAGSTANMRGVVFADGEQHFDHETLQEHIAPEASSDLLFKVVVKGQAMSVHLGTVRVHKEARGTDASQSVRNLILSPRGKAHPILPLEIEASDIRRCSHAAAVGQIDENQLFYLMSRGLSRQEAEKLVVDGFFAPVLDAIPLPMVQERLRRVVDAKLAAAG
jgi:Fe-S cluster assembly protein SufD